LFKKFSKISNNFANSYLLYFLAHLHQESIKIEHHKRRVIFQLFMIQVKGFCMISIT